MLINTIPMADQNPSGFGMPACGHASVTGIAMFGATTVVRERRAAVITGDVKGDMGLAAYVPGTSAWSPPSS
jgi:hypothetical protein